MNEALASFNGYFRSPTGNRDQFTLRQKDQQSDKEFIARVKLFVQLLAENGWKEWDAENKERSPREFEKAKLQEAIETDGATRNGKSFEVGHVRSAKRVRPASTVSLTTKKSRKPVALIVSLMSSESPARAIFVSRLTA